MFVEKITYCNTKFSRYVLPKPLPILLCCFPSKFDRTRNSLLGFSLLYFPLALAMLHWWPATGDCL